MNRSLPLRVLAVLLATAMLTLAGGFTWAVADDYTNRDVVPLGVKVAGKTVEGMSSQALRAYISESIVGPLSEPVKLSGDGKIFDIPAGDYIIVDVDAMVARAMSPRITSPLHSRVVRRIRGQAVDVDVPVLLKVKTQELVPRVVEVAEQLKRAAVDATLTVEATASAIRITPSKPGLLVDGNRLLSRVSEALLKGDKSVSIPTVAVKPAVHESSFGKTILVRLSKRHLWLFKGDKLEKDFGCAVGTRGHPTPKGWWQIVNKRYRPTWRNPGSGWAKSMPRSIPPGPSNPLGTRALDLNASGIRIHGTTKDSSIGTAASHGCMRMHRWDIENLYPRVPVGTRVIIID